MPLSQMRIQDSPERGRVPQRRRASHLEQVNAFLDDLADARRQWEMAEDHYRAGLDMRDLLAKPGGLLNPQLTWSRTHPQHHPQPYFLVVNVRDACLQTKTTKTSFHALGRRQGISKCKN